MTKKMRRDVRSLKLPENVKVTSRIIQLKYNEAITLTYNVTFHINT